MKEPSAIRASFNYQIQLNAFSLLTNLYDQVSFVLDKCTINKKDSYIMKVAFVMNFPFTEISISTS